MENGSFKVSYEATVPFLNGIFMYTAMVGAVLIIFILVIIFLVRYNRRMIKKEGITIIREELIQDSSKQAELLEEKISSDDDYL